MFTCELLSGLWIGCSDTLNSKKFIQDNQITIILNCTQLFDFPDLPVQKIRLPFSSNPNSDTDLSLLRENKQQIIEFIKENIDDNNILICCYDGKVFLLSSWLCISQNTQKLIVPPFTISC